MNQLKSKGEKASTICRRNSLTPQGLVVLTRKESIPPKGNQTETVSAMTHSPNRQWLALRVSWWQKHLVFSSFPHNPGTQGNHRKKKIIPIPAQGHAADTQLAHTHRIGIFVDKRVRGKVGADRTLRKMLHKGSVWPLWGPGTAAGFRILRIDKVLILKTNRCVPI